MRGETSLKAGQNTVRVRVRNRRGQGEFPPDALIRRSPACPLALAAASLHGRPDRCVLLASPALFPSLDRGLCSVFRSVRRLDGVSPGTMVSLRLGREHERRDFARWFRLASSSGTATAPLGKRAAPRNHLHAARRPNLSGFAPG